MNIYQFFFLHCLQFFKFIDALFWWYQIDFKYLIPSKVDFISLVKEVKLIFHKHPEISTFDQILIGLNEFFCLIAIF